MQCPAPGIAIRRLDGADASDYRTIRLAALHGSPEAFGSTYAIEAERPLSAFVERLASSVVFGAYAGQDIVGMAAFQQNSGERKRHKGFIWGLYVRPAARRSGIASALLEALVRSADSVVETLTLTVVQSNDAAQALYRTLGFRIYGVEPRALRSATGYVDEVLMVRLALHVADQLSSSESQ